MIKVVIEGIVVGSGEGYYKVYQGADEVFYINYKKEDVKINNNLIVGEKIMAKCWVKLFRQEGKEPRISIFASEVI